MNSTQSKNHLFVEEFWKPYGIPAASASLAILPAYPFFAAKSAKQSHTPFPIKTIKEGVLKSFKAVPTITTILGTQMAAQNIIEKILKNSDNENEQDNFKRIFLSSLCVGIISIPPLAVFNGQTMGKSIMQSLKSLTMGQSCAIVARETSFLFSLRISGPLCALIKETYGENKAAEYAVAALTGAIGSLAGHPADTALTLFQNGKKISSFRELLRGTKARTMAVVIFSLGFKTAKDFFEYHSK